MIVDSGHIILSAIQPETIANRLYQAGADEQEDTVQGEDEE